MEYEVNYHDMDGSIKTAAINESDSVEAIKNDYIELTKKYNPKYVTLERIKTKEGEMLHLKITVKAPSHYLCNSSDTNPKSCDSMSAHIICYPGYPLKSISAYYDSDHYLASPNVFSSGNACIDNWIPFTSSMITVADKLIHDMIHDPNVTRYDSMANHNMETWHRQGVAAKHFPTIDPALLAAPEMPSLPPRSGETVRNTNLPPLPSRGSNPSPLSNGNSCLPPLPGRNH